MRNHSKICLLLFINRLINDKFTEFHILSNLYLIGSQDMVNFSIQNALIIMNKF